MQKTTLESLDKLILEVKADLGKGQRSFTEDIRELKELTIKKRELLSLKCCITKGFFIHLKDSFLFVLFLDN